MADPTQDPRRTTLFALIGLAVVIVVIVVGLLVFSRQPTSQPGCTALTGGAPVGASGAGQLNCQ